MSINNEPIRPSLLKTGSGRCSNQPPFPRILGKNGEAGYRSPTPYREGFVSLSAFTLIELLIAVTIMGIIGIAFMSWLSRMVEVQDAETMVKTVDNTLDSFDRGVAMHRITSYEAVFSSGSLGFLIDADRYGKTTLTEYSFDFVGGTGSAKSGSTGTGAWELHFSSPDSPGTTDTLPASGGIRTFSFPSDIRKRRYDISSAIGERLLNSYTIQYYGLDNTGNNTEREVRLVRIVGDNNVPYASVRIRNILGKKELEGSGASADILKRATLFFEKNGKEIPMEISF